MSARTIAIREGVLALTGEQKIMTVRGAFYALSTRGIVPKDEGGYRSVQAQILRMRRDGILDWKFIADSTRWQRKPPTWDSHEDALEVTARTYRRNLWRSQKVRIEVWLEKDALAGIVMEATSPWDVALMVSRGSSSATFLHGSAEMATEAWEWDHIETHVFTLYDFDAGGQRAARTVERGLRQYAPHTPIIVTHLAVNVEQIAEWSLPTRPAKKSDPEAHKFGSLAVELDAIPPNVLIGLVENAIVGLIDDRAWEMEKAYEQSERTILSRIAGTS